MQLEGSIGSGAKDVGELRISARDPLFRDLISAHTTCEILSKSFTFTEGPVWHPTRHFLLFTDIPMSRIYRWSLETGFQLFKDQTNKANGLAYDRQGRLLLCEHATSRVTRLHDSGELELLAVDFNGKALNSPNDIVVASNGDIYFTDPTYGRTAKPWGVERPEEMGFRGVYRVGASTGLLNLIADDFDGPNGLCFSVDEQTLYVNDSERNHIRVFERHSNGHLTGGRVWAETKGSEDGCPDGMKVDAAGNLYCCGPGGIHIFGPDANCLGVIFLPPMVTNFAFGGADLKDLFVTASNRLYRFRVGISGLPAF